MSLKATDRVFQGASKEASCQSLGRRLKDDSDKKDLGATRVAGIMTLSAGAACVIR